MEVVAQSSTGGGTDWKAAEGVYVSPQDSDFKMYQPLGFKSSYLIEKVVWKSRLYPKLKSLTRDLLMMSYKLDLDF